MACGKKNNLGIYKMNILFGILFANTWLKEISIEKRIKEEFLWKMYTLWAVAGLPSGNMADP